MGKIAATHGFPPFIHVDSEILILGSFPSSVSRKHSFFYMHPQNRFWRVLSLLYGEDFVIADIATKKALLAKHRLALYDVVESCLIQGSRDNSITEIIPADIPAIIAAANIKQIFANGKTAGNLFDRFFPAYAPITTTLPSTSAANAAYDLTKLVESWRAVVEAPANRSLQERRLSRQRS